MTNENTQYWKRVIAYYDREMNDASNTDATRSMAARAMTSAERAQRLNSRVAELESRWTKLRAIVQTNATGNTRYDLNDWDVMRNVMDEIETGDLK